MKKLLFIFLIAVAVFSVQAQEKPKIGFMELFIAWAGDSSQMRNPANNDDFVSKVGAINVFDAAITVPVLKTDAFGLNIWHFMEWVVDAGTEKDKAGNTFTSFVFIFQPQFTFGKNYNLNTGVRFDCPIKLDFAGDQGLSVKEVDVDVYAHNNISITNMMEIWLNLYGMWKYTPSYDYPAPGTKAYTAIELVPAWSIGGPGLSDNWHFQGSIWQGDDQFWFHYVGPQYSNGIGWNLAQEFHFNLEPRYWKDGDSNANETLLNSFVLSNYVMFLWDILKLTSVKDISFTLIAANDVEVTFPYSSGAEESKTISTSGFYGAELGVKGFNFGLYLKLDTNDTYNESVGYNDEKKYYYDASKGTGRIHGTGQIGPSVKLQYFGNDIGFRLVYTGLANFRDYDCQDMDYAERETWSNSIRLDFFIFF
ncbi:MAG: hypothetical protein JXB50_12355 [Spirochaetes bacterium]|nr:hypothetical protein [Spirochaetota bacterium]